MNLYELIKKLLREHPALRDSDKKLIWSVWIKEGKIKDGRITLEDYLESMPEESITRARRKVQEASPELKPSPLIEAMRNNKAETRGTFIKSATVQEDEPISMSFETRVELLKKAKDEMIKRGLLHKDL